MSLQAICLPRCTHVFEQEVTIIYLGVGTTPCWECGGDGDWTKFVPWDAEPGSVPCVDCKGTGICYVDAWGKPK